MKIRFWLAFMASLLIWSCSEQADHSRVEKLLEESRQQFCPDKRVCIWELSVSSKKPFVLKGSTNLPEAKKQFIQALTEAEIGFIDSIRVLPSIGLEGKHFGLVRVSVCNIRTKPRHSAELATQAPMGTPLWVYEQQGEWFRVQTPDRYLGWLDAGGFVPCDSPTFENWQQSDKLMVTNEFAFAYTTPAPNSPTLSDLVSGCILSLKGDTSDYYIVEFPDGRSGYVHLKDALPFSHWLELANPSPENILESASALLGRPYLWGGTSVKGMDCSGFTKTVFFQNGLLLPRDASQQVHVGTSVDTDTTFSQLLPGDLLFFGRKPTQDLPEKITHVAIYVGEGKFIHASSQVKVESLFPKDPVFSEYRLSTFVRAQRLWFPNPDNPLHINNQEGYN